MGETSQGPRVHPALVKLRQQRIALARLFAAFGRPDRARFGAYPASRCPRCVRHPGRVVRRRVKAADAVPAQLAEFTSADWPGGTVEQRVALWKAARVAWHDENGWPGGPLDLFRGVSHNAGSRGAPCCRGGRTQAELDRLQVEEPR
jgi:hypothetical protein